MMDVMKSVHWKRCFMFVYSWKGKDFAVASFVYQYMQLHSLFFISVVTSISH